MFIFNGKTLKDIKYNAMNVAKVIYNGVTVWVNKVLEWGWGVPGVLYGSTGDSLDSFYMEGSTRQSNYSPTYAKPSTIQSIGDYDEATGKYKIPIVVSDSNKSITTTILLDEPLRGVAHRFDALNYYNGNASVSRYIKKEHITKVDGKSSVNGTYSLFLSIIQSKPMVEEGFANCISNKFGEGDYNYSMLPRYKNVIKTYITNAGAIRVAYTLDGKQTIQEAQELIGDGFDVYYVLDTPTYEQIELPEIPTLEGDVTIDIDTTVKPSYVDYSYYRKG